MTKKSKAMKVKNEEIASKILRTVTYNEAFYFFTDIGQHIGELAASLAEFCQKIDMKSIDFHFKPRISRNGSEKPYEMLTLQMRSIESKNQFEERNSESKYTKLWRGV